MLSDVTLPTWMLWAAGGLAAVAVLGVVLSWLRNRPKGRTTATPVTVRQRKSALRCGRRALRDWMTLSAAAASRTAHAIWVTRRVPVKPILANDLRDRLQQHETDAAVGADTATNVATGQVD